MSDVLNSHRNARIRWWTPLIVLVAAPALGAAIGAATNLVNVLISPDYFRVVMNVMWYLGPLGVRGFAVREGLIEGAALGCAVGLLMSISIAGSTRLQCPLAFALQHLAIVLGIVFGCWILGGLAGMVLMWRMPNLWGTFFWSVPIGASPFGLSWVGGTIWGAYAGSAIALAASTIILHLRWKRSLARARAGFAVLT
jgi:hypothetical protein